VLAWLLFAVAMLFPEFAPRNSATSDEPLVITGLIDNSVVHQIRGYRGDHIMIDSRGGQVAAGLQVADLVSKRKMTVTVTDRCYSACFSFVFLPAARREVLAGATLAMHPGEIESMLLARQRSVPLGLKTEQVALQHEAALARVGLGLALFHESIRLMQLELVPGPAICPNSLLRPGEDKNAAMCQLSIGKYKAWYPTSDQLMRLGVELHGPPITYHSIDDIHRKINVANRDRPVVFGECQYEPSRLPALNCMH
jgi:hypothetical protein